MRHLAAAAVLVVGVAGGSAFVHACSLDGGMSAEVFTLQHPQSLRVALAINRAVSEGIIGGVAAKPSALTFYKVTSYLNRLRNLFSEAERPLPRDMEFSILLVEYGLWARVKSSKEDGLSMAVHVQKPNDAATVMVTGDAVVRALVDHKITLREAMDRDLVVFSGKNEGTLAASFGTAIEPRGPRT